MNEYRAIVLEDEDGAIKVFLVPEAVASAQAGTLDAVRERVAEVGYRVRNIVANVVTDYEAVAAEVGA